MFQVVAASLFAGTFSIVVADEISLLQVKIRAHVNSSVGSQGSSNAACPCVSFNAVPGTAPVVINDAVVDYPADIGSACQPWDYNRHPDCKGPFAPDWCGDQWCYVDPCNCNIDTLPKTTDYFPDAVYLAKPLYYSYATCGATDAYSSAEKKDQNDQDAIDTACTTPMHEQIWGQDGCRCVGIGGKPGNIAVSIAGEQLLFPGDTGGYCSKWEENRHPDCLGASPPDWCTQAWCWVDPCTCNTDAPPTWSTFLPDSNCQGKPIYASYETCGGTDTFSASMNSIACPTQKTSDDCALQEQCAWSGGNCIRLELLEVCR